MIILCEDCGCEEDNVEVNKVIMDDNEKLASKINHKLMHKKVLPVNIMGSPGAGKTTFIQQLAKIIDAGKLAVLQGDLENNIDKEKLEKEGIYTWQINTHSGCHLNADMVMNSINNMDLEGKDFLLIENVGNLVCPADIKIGQEVNIVVSSTPEGSDKPAKYPIIFYDADMVVVTKYDIADHVDFSIKEYEEQLKKLKEIKIVRASVKDDEGFMEAADFLKEKYKEWERKKTEHEQHH